MVVRRRSKIVLQLLFGEIRNLGLVVGGTIHLALLVFFVSYLNKQEFLNFIKPPPKKKN